MDASEILKKYREAVGNKLDKSVETLKIAQLGIELERAVGDLEAECEDLKIGTALRHRMKLKVISEESMKKAYQKGLDLKAEFDKEEAHCSQSYRLMEVSFLYGLLGFHWDGEIVVGLKAIV